MQVTHCEQYRECELINIGLDWNGRLNNCLVCFINSRCCHLPLAIEGRTKGYLTKKFLQDAYNSLPNMFCQFIVFHTTNIELIIR